VQVAGPGQQRLDALQQFGLDLQVHRTAVKLGAFDALVRADQQAPAVRQLVLALADEEALLVGRGHLAGRRVGGLHADPGLGRRGVGKGDRLRRQQQPCTAEQHQQRQAGHAWQTGPHRRPTVPRTPSIPRKQTHHCYNSRPGPAA